MCPDWTLRVPVIRPRLVAWLDGAILIIIVVMVAFSLHRQGLALILTGGLAALIGWRAWHSVRRVPPVSGLLITRGGALYLRMNGKWQPVVVVSIWPGLRWLTLRVQLPVGITPVGITLDNFFRRTSLTFTVWQDALPASAWRRVCLLTARRQSVSPLR